MDEGEFERYVDGLLGGEDPTLVEMRNEARERGIPTIQVPPELARLLELLVAVTRPRRVLEFGTLFGYSAINLARSLPPDGHVWTLELSSLHAGIARANLERAGVAERVSVIEGPALESVAQLGAEPFDFVFIDADKPSYPAYLEAVMGHVHSGSVIVADNLWRGGAVMEPDDDVTRGIARFNQMVSGDTRLRTVILSNRGGEDALSISLVR
jgi:caffeoyl-CoA O-methyltransferase